MDVYIKPVHKKIIGFVLVILLTLFLLPVHASAVAVPPDSPICLSTAEEIYALSRLLSSVTTKADHIYSCAGNSRQEQDFSLFPIPDAYRSDSEKIQYLAGADYCLTANISLCFQTTENYFMGIGCPENPFSGTFNGNGHTIMLSQEDSSIFHCYAPYFSLFPVLKDSTVENLNIQITDDIIITNSQSSISIGAIAGIGTCSTFSHCTVTIRDSVFGADFSEANAMRTNICAGGIAGRLDSSVITNCEVILDNAQLVAGEHNDSQKTQIALGGFAGRSRGDMQRSTVTNCIFRGTNSSITNHVIDTGTTAAYFGTAAATTISNCSVLLQNTVIASIGANVNTDSMYSVVSTGGMIGFSQAGSNNTSNIGVVGNHITNCTLVSDNASQQDVILSRARTGSELTAGGLVGCSFNNLLIDNSSVEISHGNISAIKSGLGETQSPFGTQAGGIVGRLEHTGELLQCHVHGDYLNILSQSPNNQSSAGGIVGIDLGPFHKDITSLNQCTFDGGNTSQIRVHILFPNKADQKIVSVGGIAGTSTYRIEGCAVRNVAIICQTPRIANPYYTGTIIGHHITNSGLWISNQHFKPQAPEIIRCQESNVDISHIFNPEIRTDTTMIASVSRAKNLSLKDVIYMKAVIAFTPGTGKITPDKTQILENGRLLFWSEKDMPHPDDAGIETATAVQMLSDGGIYSDGIQEYYAYSHGIAAAEYADTIYYRTYITIDGTAYYGDIFQYSILTYADNQFKKTSASAHALKPLLAAMLNYGAAAQVHFGYKIDTLANADLQKWSEKGLLDANHLTLHWDDALLNTPDSVSTAMAVSFIQNNAKRTARSLVLRGMIQPKLTFAYNIDNGKGSPLPTGGSIIIYYWTGAKYAELDALGIPLSKNNASLILSDNDITKVFSSQYGYEYAAYFPGIPAKQLDDAFYTAAVFTMADGTQYCSGVEAYSPEMYVKSTLAKDTTGASLANLLKWMVIYGEAAKCYYD